MSDLEKPLTSLDRGLSGARGLPPIGTAVLLVLLIAYGLGFAVLSPLVEASASKSAAEGNDPTLFTGS